MTSLFKLIAMKPPDRRVVRFIEKVCKYFGTTSEEAYNNRRSREQPYILIRYFVYYHLKESTRKSLSTIGRIYGQPHSTVINAISSLKEWVDTDVKMQMYHKHILKKAKVLKGEVSSILPVVKSLPRKFTLTEMYNLHKLAFNEESANHLIRFYNKYNYEEKNSKSIEAK